MESRPFGCKAVSRVPDREGTAGDRPGPKGGLGACPPSPVRPSYSDHPLQPCGLPGPAPLSLYLSSSSWLGTRYTPPSTHPLYPSQVPTRCTAPLDVAAVGYWVSLGACTYDRFEDVLGEPRGLRTHPVFRVPDWLYTVIEVHTAVGRVLRLVYD